MTMQLRQLRAVLVFLLIVVILELSVAFSIIYFSRLPFLFALFVVALRMLSFFLLGFVVVFFGFTLFGLQPALTIEWWSSHLREYTRSIVGSTILACISIAFCVVLGASVAIILERFFLTAPIEAMRQWVATHIR